jgi:outer membrane protein OmpA-like peptidoglycan-associated protein
MIGRGFVRGSISGAVLAASLVLGNAAALAQDRAPASNGQGMDTHLFRPALDSKGFFTTNGADILGKNDVSFGLVMDYGRNLMRLAPGREASALVSHSFQGTLGISFGLFNVGTIGISAPVDLMAGDEIRAIGPAAAPYDSGKLDLQNLGFVALHAKLRLLRPEKGFGVALAMQGGVPPSGSAPRSLGADPGGWYWPQAILEGRIGSQGQLRLGANAGYRGHTGKNPTFDQLAEGHFENGNLLTAGFGLSVRALEALDIVGDTYLTQIATGSSTAAQKLSAEAIGGLKVFVENKSFLMLGAGRRYTKGFEAADLRLFIGFVFEPSIGDRDGDGYKDDEDKCPDEPEDFDGFQDQDGCPDPDNDNDGILDVDDQCPNVPEDRDGDEDQDGCPEGSEGDRDGDGILDSVDKCPDVPEDRDGFEDQDGCPDPDNDQDGIPDKADKCPNDPEDRDGFEDADGCPDPDNDKDGIPDVVDKCPNDPETYNGFEDEDGCPDKGKVVIEENNILILEKIMFKTNSAEILPESNSILDAVATTLIHHPEFLLIEVAGHADERNDDNYNLRLTKDRATAVKQALVKRNLGADKLRAMGYGEFCPIDPGHNAAAWEKNRRVEFKVVRTQDGPTGVETGCARAKQKGVVPPEE